MLSLLGPLRRGAQCVNVFAHARGRRIDIENGNPLSLAVVTRKSRIPLSKRTSSSRI
jgi:hypothetical protein